MLVHCDYLIDILGNPEYMRQCICHILLYTLGICSFWDLDSIFGDYRLGTSPK